MDDILTSEYRIKDITEIDLNVVFLHYTNVSNLKRIFENGLEPRIGSNSKGVEISKKIFFSIGDKGMLMLMDVWLKWLNTIPKNKLLFEIGSYFLKKSWFPKIIFKIIFSVWKKSKKRFIKNCKNLKNILDNSIFLILDLEEKIDFDFNDIDEVKIQKFPKEMVKNVYTTESDVEDVTMEYWNMHTYSDKAIDKNKISLLKVNNNYSASDVLIYMANKNNQYVIEKCPFLYEYLKFINCNK